MNHTPPLKSLIFLGGISHTRFTPKVHHFQYPMYIYALDLDELPIIPKCIPIFSYNRFNITSIFDKDYLTKDTGSIKLKLLRFLQSQGCHEPVDRITLVTEARYFHYIFNSVSFYYCWGVDGALKYFVSEVNNTYGDKHLYLGKDLTSSKAPFIKEYKAPKEFHVSPFFDMSPEYHFLISDIQKQLDIRIHLSREGKNIFQSRIYGKPIPLTMKNLAKTICMNPIAPWKSMPRIVFQGVLLHYKKKLKIIPRPNPVSPMTIRTAKPSFFQKICVKLIRPFFKQLKYGKLIVIFPDKMVETYGQNCLLGKPPITLSIHNYSMFTKALLKSEIGLGESYVNGDWDADNVVALFELLSLNKKSVRRNIFTAVLERTLFYFNRLFVKNNLFNSKKQISHHYDLSNEMFSCFLDPSMSYSCAIFKSPYESLEQAQLNKWHAIINKAELNEKDHVLEIGCGWGALAIEAVRKTGCRWTGISLSEKQLQYARAKVKDAGLEDRIELKLVDWRELKGSYDKIVSVEMFEAIGKPYWNLFFDQCYQLLNPGGLVCLQTITVNDAGFKTYSKGANWIQKHIFPGGFLPSTTAFLQAAATRLPFIIKSLENIGLHYGKTLQLWKEQFLEEEKKVLEMGFDKTFIRSWFYYLAICEAGFKTQYFGDIQVVLSRPKIPGSLEELLFPREETPEFVKAR